MPYPNYHSEFHHAVCISIYKMNGSCSPKVPYTSQKVRNAQTNLKNNILIDINLAEKGCISKKSGYCFFYFSSLAPLPKGCPSVKLMIDSLCVHLKALKSRFSASKRCFALSSRLPRLFAFYLFFCWKGKRFKKVQKASEGLQGIFLHRKCVFFGKTLSCTEYWWADPQIWSIPPLHHSHSFGWIRFHRSLIFRKWGLKKGEKAEFSPILPPRRRKIFFSPNLDGR